jgi:ParB family chromosome partitioning protein
VENVQRYDLTPVEEAEAMQRLIEEFNYNHDQLSSVLGKSRPHITNLLRILKLPADVKYMINQGEISMGHAKAIVALENPLEIAQMIKAKGLNVRQTEKLVQDILKGKNGKTSVVSNNNKKKIISNQNKDQDLIDLEQDLSNSLGLKVAVIYDGGPAGQLNIEFSSLEQLDKLIRLLSGGKI